MLTITLDTNEIITPGQTPLINRIKELALAGKIDIAVTTRVVADTDQDHDEDRKLAHLKAFDEYPKIGTILRCGPWVCGSGDFCGDSEISKLIEQIIFRGIRSDDKHSHNKWADVDHLTGHYLSKRDVFVTEDKDILSKAEELKGMQIKVQKLKTLVNLFDHE